MNVKEMIPEEIDEEVESNVSLQSFFNDMDMLGKQVSDKNIRKPTFFYGDISVTNYLLWLILAELKSGKSKTRKKVTKKEPEIEEPEDIEDEEPESDNMRSYEPIAGRRPLNG